MQTRRVLAAALVIGGLVFSVLAPGSVQADDSALGSVGYAVMPLDNEQVQMVAERVEADLSAWGAQVTCVFTFTNAGTATTVLMGFPEAQGRPGRGDNPSLKDFRAYVDGREVAVIFRPQAQPQDFPDYAGWHTFSVHFEAGQTRTVRNTYRGSLTYISNGGNFFQYILQSGATWAGTIREANITVRWSRQRDVALNTVSARPSGYTQQGYELHWTFRDFEPTSDHNIEVSFYSVVGPSNGGIAAASSGNVVSEWFGLFQPSAPFADNNPSTAWVSDGEVSGAWIMWSSNGQAEWVAPTLGLGILPGLVGSDFREHGRPKEILVQLAQLKKGNTQRLYLAPELGTFLSPPPAVEIRQVRFTLQDTPRWQFLNLDEPAIVLAFQITVESVYPGRRYDDVAIAEVWFPVLEEDIATSFSFLPGTGEGGKNEAEQDLANSALQPMVAALGVLLVASGAAIRLCLHYRYAEQRTRASHTPQNTRLAHTRIARHEG